MNLEEQSRLSHDDVDYEEIPKWRDIKQMERVEDFLPPPEQLIYRESSVEPVTVVLAEETARYFHERSKETGLSYRYLIQELLNNHVAKQMSR